jgi:DNA-binding response OmpR family regulator
MHQAIKKSKILIIDDNNTNLDLMVEILNQEGYGNIQTLSDPEKAFETINKVEPDLLILDLMMPHISGFEILKERNTFLNEKWYMPIIVITASNNPSDRKRALNLGASDFLTKPFDLNEVSLRIKNTLLTGYLLKREKLLTENLEQEVSKRTKELEEEKLIAEKNERKYRKLFDSNADAINLFTISNGVPSNFL